MKHYSPSAYAFAIFIALVAVILWLAFCQWDTG
jgi:hypothetical protein